jgi:hypothetical protein
LKQGGAMAVLDLGKGRRVGVGLGMTEIPPEFGRARVAVFDRLGRFLRGQTEPKTSGYLTVRFASNKTNPRADQ